MLFSRETTKKYSKNYRNLYIKPRKSVGKPLIKQIKRYIIQQFPCINTDNRDNNVVLDESR